MKKFLAIFMAIILLFAAVGCDKADGEGEESETLKGEELLAGKSAKDVYNAAIEYIKALENYEIDIESNYKTTYEGEVSEENAFTTHKCSGDTFEYKYTAENYDEFFLHDGTALYKKVNSIAERETDAMVLNILQARTDFLTRSKFLAPKFCPTKVVVAIPKLPTVIQNIASSLP